MKIYDADGAERDWGWVKEKYNLPEINEAPRDEDHWEVVELRENCRDSSMTVRLCPGYIDPEIEGVKIYFGWPGDYVIQKTDKNGQTGFGMGGGAYYPPEEGAGPHVVYVAQGRSDVVRGLGMLGKRDHWHLEPTFQFVRGEIEPPSPPPDCEEYISALERIREEIDSICPR